MVGVGIGFRATKTGLGAQSVLVLFFVALWFILRGDLFYVFLVLFCFCVFQSF